MDYQFTSASILLRLLLSDEHYANDSLSNAAISTSDLKERGFSLDIKELAREDVVNTRAESQMANRPQTRFAAYISEFSHGDIISITDNSNNVLFEVIYDPVDGNDAHACILCIDKANTKSHYVMARNKLKPALLKNVTKIEDFLFEN